MQLRAALERALALGDAGVPRAAELEALFLPDATHVTVAGPGLQMPEWGAGVRRASDRFVSLDGELRGAQAWEDERGWGTYLDLAVARGTLADVEQIVGATSAMPRNPGDFRSGPKRAAYLKRGGRTVRVFVELGREDMNVARVTLHFQST